jgi:hypothetical protein
MLTSQVYWRVKGLVSSLSRSNYEEHRSEMNEIMRANGDNARVMYISTLLDEVDFSVPHANRDELKVIYLSGEYDSSCLMYEVALFVV